MSLSNFDQSSKMKLSNCKSCSRGRLFVRKSEHIGKNLKETWKTKIVRFPHHLSCTIYETFELSAW